MKKKSSRHLKWRVGFIIFWIIIVPLIFVLIGSITEGLGFSFLIFGVIFLIFGVIATFFNKKLYGHMIKVNSWGFEKMNMDQMDKAVKSEYYKKFYRVSTFIVGLLLIILGIFSILFYFGIDLRNFF